MLTPADPATKATDVTLPVGASAGAAIEIAMEACLDHLQPNEACWLASGHPDCLHQIRVSTRRLRALFSLLRRLVRDDLVALDLKARLRLTLLPLGPARDLDVALLRAREEDWSAGDLARVEDARSAAYAQVRAVLTGPTWRTLWDDLDAWRGSSTWLDHVGAWRDGPARGVTDHALDRRYRRIVLAGPQLMHLSDHELHRIRIEGKKLRYGCQFFDTLYPGAGTVETDDGREISVPLHLAETLSDLQDVFGRVNDQVVAARLRSELGLVGGGSPTEPPPTRLQCLQAWERVAVQPPFWRLT